jgi:small subunit ribosomal protein S16
VAVKIKLKRLGRTRVPTYRIVVADARTKRDGRAIEEIGKYHPKEEPSLIEVNSERAQHWLSVGAQPTPPVMTILKITGDWQKFKGEPGSEGTLRTREPAADKKEVFAAALKDAGKGSADAGSTTPKGGSRTRKSDTAKSDTAKSDTAKTETAKTETAKTETAKTDSPKADSTKSDSAKSGGAKAEAKGEPGKGKPKAGSADEAAGAAASSEAPAGEAKAAAQDSEQGSEA